LADALAMAEGGNPSYRRATNDALLNGVEMRTTWLDRILPRANLTLFNTAYTGNLQRIGRDNFGNPIENPEAKWIYFSNTMHSVNLSWNVRGLSLFQAHRGQSLTNQRREIARERALTGVQVEVQRRYLDAVRQRELAALEEDLVAARGIDLDVAERLFSLAGRTRVDVLNAELAVERQVLASRQQRSAYEGAVLALRTALGTDETRPLELVAEELPLFDPVGLRPSDLISRALEVNPAVRESGVAVRQADLALAEQRNEWWPELAFGLQFFRREQVEGTSALFDPTVSRDLESNFFVQLSIPVLNDFFQTRQSQERAAIELSNQRETDREARLQLEADIRRTLLELRNQWESLRVSERSSVIAGEALRLAREEYRLGTLRFEDLRTSFQQEADIRREVIKARYDFVDSLLTLEEAVGAPVRPVPSVAAGVSGG
jgi:outer membrane protein